MSNIQRKLKWADKHFKKKNDYLSLTLINICKLLKVCFLNYDYGEYHTSQIPSSLNYQKF